MEHLDQTALKLHAFTAVSGKVVLKKRKVYVKRHQDRLLLYRHHVEQCYNPCDEQSFVVVKTFKTLLLSLAVSDLGVGLIVQP